MQTFRDRLWPRHVRNPWTRLVAGFVVAPASATIVIAMIAFMIAGVSEATRAGTLVVTIDATLAFVNFVIVLMIAAVAPAVAVLALARWRSGIVWTAMGGLAGIATAYFLAELRGSPLYPAIPVGGVTAAYLMAVLRWVSGIRRDPAELDLEDPRYVP
ncbi:MAG: hypothetical protein AAF899_13365 [Pseudomonadota bacterium]